MQQIISHKSFDFSASENMNCFVAKTNSSRWRKQQSCNTLWAERREAMRGVVGQHITFRFDPVGVVSLQLCHGATGPAPRWVCSALNAQHAGERRVLLRAGIVKHYGDVQIRNSQEEISCSVTHTCMRANTHRCTHTRRPTLPSSQAVFLAKAPFRTLAREIQRMYFVIWKHRTELHTQLSQ